MLRLKLIASVVPLLVAGVFARDSLLHDVRPCIAFGDTSVQLAASRWQTAAHVGFTPDASAATIKVQLVDSPDIADFAVIDDVGTGDEESCPVNAATRFVTIDDEPTGRATRIFLSTDAGGDYRVYVSSRRFTAWRPRP